MANDKAIKTLSNGSSPKNTNQLQINVVAQYIRDLSFECPNVEILLSGPGESPNLDVEINVNAKNISKNIYESEIDFTASASNSEDVIYDLELIYCGIFKLENVTKDALEPLLLVHCPTLIFPFVRRIIADLTRENGFPPLFLEPIDFSRLYHQRRKAEPN